MSNNIDISDIPDISDISDNEVSNIILDKPKPKPKTNLNTIKKIKNKIEFKKNKTDNKDLNKNIPNENIKTTETETETEIEKETELKIETEIETETNKTSKQKTTTKVEDKFEFNEETINFFTKDLDVKKILIKHPPNSPYLEKLNDTILICLLIKIGHFKNYHCNTTKCKVGKLWNGHPIQLFLIRINNIQNDLSISNLDLICPNCYMVTYGLDIFIKKKKESILLCTFCDFPLVKFKDSRKKKGICLACENKMKQISHIKQEDNYYNKLKNMYNDNPVLSDDIKHTNYYSEVSKYKKLDTYKPEIKNNKNNQGNQGNQGNQDQLQPIIELNMNIPNLCDLINDE